MNNINEFIDWAGTQRRAAELLGISVPHMSRLANGVRAVTPDVALRIEQASEGRFSKEAFIWPSESA